MPVERRSQKKSKILDKGSIPFHALLKWSEHITKSLGWIVLSVYGYGETHRRNDYLQEIDHFVRYLKMKNSFSKLQEYEISILLKSTLAFQSCVKTILLQKKCLTDILCVKDTPSRPQETLKVQPSYTHVKCCHNSLFKTFGWIVYSIIDKNEESLISFRHRVNEVLSHLRIAKKGYQDSFKTTDLQARDRIQDLENMIQNVEALKDFI